MVRIISFGNKENLDFILTKSILGLVVTEKSKITKTFTIHILGLKLNFEFLIFVISCISSVRILGEI